MAFIPRILAPGRDHFFLLGPRGTSKTLWSTHHYPQALRIDLLDPEKLRLLSARPERLTELVEGNRAKPQIIIDEVQKLPALLEVVHLLIERKTGQQFILTGSSVASDGHSLVPLLREAPGHAPRDWIYAHRDTSRTVRDQRFKLDSEGGFFEITLDPDQKNRVSPDKRSRHCHRPPRTDYRAGLHPCSSCDGPISRLHTRPHA